MNIRRTVVKKVHTANAKAAAKQLKASGTPAAARGKRVGLTAAQRKQLRNK